MNFAINPISANSISASSVISSYKQSVNKAAEVSSVVYESLEYLTGANNNLTLQNLKDLKQTLENENLTGYSAYDLVNTVISRFDSLSSDGKVITQSDFTGAVSFSVAQQFSSNSAVSVILQKSGVSVSDAVRQMFDDANAQTLAFIQLVDSLSDESFSKLMDAIDSSQKEKTADKTSERSEKSSYASNPISLSNLVSQLPPAQRSRHLLTFSNDTQKFCSSSLSQNFLGQNKTQCPAFLSVMVDVRV